MAVAKAPKKKKSKSEVSVETMLKAYKLMCMSKRMAETYDEKKEICSKYVHSTSRGHEAIQLAVGLHLKSYDYAALYYRDESILLGIGVARYFYI